MVAVYFDSLLVKLRETELGRDASVFTGVRPLTSKLEWKT